jgi:plastocyanin domain-containing protein
MSIAQMAVTLGGLATSIFIVWFFWFAPKMQARVTTTSSGAQEVAITVKGGYTPDIIVAKSGQPLRIHFTRQESSSCSEMVLFPEFNQSAMLPEGVEVLVEFTPDKPGEYNFQCQMGMLRGKLIIE